MLTESQRDELVSVLAGALDMTIATLRDDGWPQATAVSFVHDGIRIYFGTFAGAQKAHNIERDNRVSVSITDPYRAWHEIRGVSLGGRAHRVTETPELGHVAQLMIMRFPQIAEFVNFAPGSEGVLYRIDAEVISLLDYAKGFGHTELLHPV